ncbi:chemotaxis protein CheC, partial [Bacillus pumilus]
MSIFNEIKDEQLDVLREVGNIGAGHAASALASLLD